MPAPPECLITDIGTLAVVPPGPVPGRRMGDVTCLRDAYVHLSNGRIASFGPMASAPGHVVHRYSAEGGCVIPGLIDCHTHISFAGRRTEEFCRRVAGETYLQILEAGGGIRVTTKAVRQATLEALVEENLPRLARMHSAGVTTVECKSGYGLTRADEIKQLEAIALLAARQPVKLIPTFLGAHAVPAEFDGRPDEFLEEIAAPDFLAALSQRGLARFCDVFCDRGAFNVEQARRVLTRARIAGLRPKMHADELAQIGASVLAAEMQAVSADHLEHIDERGIAALLEAGTVPVVLPGTSFFLGIPHADARQMMQANLPLALATDCNPGSSMIESLPLIMNIAVCQLRLQPIETLVACTANAAAALELQADRGAIHPGYAADLVVLEAESVEEWMYEVGRRRVRRTFIDGVAYPAA